MSAPSSTPPAVVSGAGFIPFVGRVRELAALDAALALMLEGRGTMVLLGGEPGIGKTRLADELIDRARRRGATVCRGRCWEGEGAPAFWPWVQAVRQYMRGRDPAELLADLGLAAADVARVVPEVGALPPGVPSGGRASASGREQERFRFFDGLTGFIGAAARRQPLLVALEDLQWADTPSLLLLRFLARELGDMRVLVLLTYRDGGLTAEHSLSPTLAALARERACQRLTLGGFDRGEIARYIELVARRRPPARVINALHERTDGNPLFVQEVARLLASVGQLDADAAPATWRLAVPPEVRQTIVRRIAPLPAPCRHLLDVAAPATSAATCPIPSVASTGTCSRSECLGGALARRLAAASRFMGCRESRCDARCPALSLRRSIHRSRTREQPANPQRLHPTALRCRTGPHRCDRAHPPRRRVPALRASTRSWRRTWLPVRWRCRSSSSTPPPISGRRRGSAAPPRH